MQYHVQRCLISAHVGGSSSPLTNISWGHGLAERGCVLLLVATRPRPCAFKRESVLMRYARPGLLLTGRRQFVYGPGREAVKGIFSYSPTQLNNLLNSLL